jgi:hypothetical protein
MLYSLGLRRAGLFWASLLWVWSLAVAQDTAAPTEAPITPAPTTVSWQGCEDPVAGKKLVTIGEKTTICLTIGDGTDWSAPRNYMRVNFQPIADEYSRFHVPSCKYHTGCVHAQVSGGQTKERE